MITQEEKVDQVRSVTLDCQWGTGERLRVSSSTNLSEKVVANVICAGMAKR
ncbi:hypothetical protein VIOR103205_16000 [Vibrio ordalii]|uniref:hypothetical protein n=1 Tax=Vibrio ordalii TaxID=28174 RepID=UPI0039EBEB54